MRKAAPLALLLLALALAAGCGDDGAASDDDSHGVPGADLTHTGPPEQKIAEEDPGALAARWWRWAASQPEGRDPIGDESGADCTRGQRGDTFFLAGTFGGKARRTCAVPSGRRLFFPVLNRVCVGEPASSCGEGLEDEARMEAAVDGKAVEPEWAASEPFDLRPTERSPLAEFRGRAVAVGYYVTVPALAAGSHVVTFSGRDADGFAVDVRYRLRVAG